MAPKNNMTVLTYFTVMTSPEGSGGVVRTWQLEAAVKTFREYNPTRSAWLFAYNEVRPNTRELCHTYDISLKPMGSYDAALKELHPDGWWALRCHPVLQRWLALRHIPDAIERILYLDIDTLCLSDLDRLLASHQEADVYTREEPYSRRSPLGYDASMVDEEGFSDLAEQLGFGSVQPFNAGVVLFNHGAWRALRDHLPDAIDLIWRFSLSLAQSQESLDGVNRKVAEAIRTRLKKLPMQQLKRAVPHYPTASPCDVHQVATWLWLGKLGLSHEQLRSDLVLQSDEFAEVDLRHKDRKVIRILHEK